MNPEDEATGTSATQATYGQPTGAKAPSPGVKATPGGSGRDKALEAQAPGVA